MLKVPFIDEQHYNMLCTIEWVWLVPLTAAPFSFEMDVVLVGVALFFVMHFLAPPDFSCTHVLLCVCASALSCNGESELR